MRRLGAGKIFSESILSILIRFFLVKERPLSQRLVHNGSGWIRHNATTLSGDIDKLEATGFTLS